MTDPSRGVTVAFNGEIYNFRELRKEFERLGRVFVSTSDTEVLLAAYEAWGTDCIGRLNGMFAFALHDARRGILFLARDRAGEKPLFYHLSGDTLHFASELKALLLNPELPRAIDPEALDCYLAMGYVPGERCILKGYCKLPPAHAMTFDLQTGRADVRRYWSLPDFDPGEEGGEREDEALLDTLEGLLEDSVRRQLVADVPVGVLLSGGVDSSLVTAMASRSSAKVMTFTVRFPGAGAYDETEHARLIARHFGTQHLELEARPAQVDLISRLARQYDEPMADSSMIPSAMVCELIRQHCAVALGGDGADEMFGGYEHYRRLAWMQGRVRGIPRFVLRTLSRAGAAVMPVGVRGRNWVQALDSDLRKELPLLLSFFDARSRPRLVPQLGSYAGAAEAIYAAIVSPTGDVVQRATRTDFLGYLAEDILVKMDRASMLHSLEIRAPFLDHRLVEFAFGRVPASLKATAVDRKILLKRLCARALPRDFNSRRKQGFSIPMADWLKSGPFRDLFYEVLLDSGCLFDRRMVTGLLRGQDAGRDNGERLFALVLFEQWRRQYSIRI